MQINAYLMFTGHCEEAFAFYARTLGGEVIMTMRFADMPSSGAGPKDWQDKIAHTRLQVGEHVLMGSDAPPDQAASAQGFRVTLGIDDPVEAERVFGALAEGGAVQMPLQETFWAVRFGMLTDRFGTPWMVNCERPAAGAHP